MNEIYVIKLVPDGQSLSVVLPKSMTDCLNLAAGDTLHAVETELGILLTPHDSELMRVMRAEQQISTRYGNALRALAE